MAMFRVTKTVVIQKEVFSKGVAYFEKKDLAIQSANNLADQHESMHHGHGYFYDEALISAETTKIHGAHTYTYENASVCIYVSTVSPHQRPINAEEFLEYL